MFRYRYLGPTWPGNSDFQLSDDQWRSVGSLTESSSLFFLIAAIFASGHRAIALVRDSSVEVSCFKSWLPRCCTGSEAFVPIKPHWHKHVRLIPSPYMISNYVNQTAKLQKHQKQFPSKILPWFRCFKTANQLPTWLLQSPVSGSDVWTQLPRDLQYHPLPSSPVLRGNVTMTIPKLNSSWVTTLFTGVSQTQTNNIK